MKNFSKVQLPSAEQETSEKQVQKDEVGSSTATPPPPPLEIEVYPSEDGGILGFGFLFMIIVLLVGRILSKRMFGKSNNTLMVKIIRPTKKVKITRKEAPAVEVDVLMHESPAVRKAIEELYVLHPKACRNCHGSATEPEFFLSGQGEEECHVCYARGRDPYDTTKKMKKDGEYLISPSYGTDPLYRGYALPGQRILAMREEEEDLRREEQEEADQWEA